LLDRHLLGFQQRADGFHWRAGYDHVGELLSHTRSLPHQDAPAAPDQTHHTPPVRGTGAHPTRQPGQRRPHPAKPGPQDQHRRSRSASQLNRGIGSEMLTRTSRVSADRCEGSSPAWMQQTTQWARARQGGLALAKSPGAHAAPRLAPRAPRRGHQHRCRDLRRRIVPKPDGRRVAHRAPRRRARRGGPARVR
jgi:hypothetical protein